MVILILKRTPSRKFVNLQEQIKYYLLMNESKITSTCSSCVTQQCIQISIWLCNLNNRSFSCLTFRGSFRMRYFPSDNFMQVSIMQRSIPQALSILRAIWAANSFGRNCCVPRMACLEESRQFTRDTYLSEIFKKEAILTPLNTRGLFLV